MKENEIENFLKKKYEKIEIKVNYESFRDYSIIIKIEYKGTLYESLFYYKYNAHLSFEKNCYNIIDIIDSIILSFYKKGMKL